MKAYELQYTDIDIEATEQGRLIVSLWGTSVEILTTELVDVHKGVNGKWIKQDMPLEVI